MKIWSSIAKFVPKVGVVSATPVAVPDEIGKALLAQYDFMHPAEEEPSSGANQSVEVKHRGGNRG